MRIWDFDEICVKSKVMHRSMNREKKVVNMNYIDKTQQVLEYYEKKLSELEENNQELKIAIQKEKIEE